MPQSQSSPFTQRQRDWLEHFHRCQSSGQTIAEYAAANSMTAQSMYAAKKVLVSKGALPRTQPVQFQRAQIADAVDPCQWRIQMPNGIVVAFTGTVDEAMLTRVLNAAAAVS